MTDTVAVPQIVDSHCHLDFDSLAEDLPGVIARAEAAGVTRMVTICTRLRNAPAVRAIAGYSLLLLLFRGCGSSCVCRRFSGS